MLQGLGDAVERRRTLDCGGDRGGDHHIGDLRELFAALLRDHHHKPLAYERPKARANTKVRVCVMSVAEDGKYGRQGTAGVVKSGVTYAGALQQRPPFDVVGVGN